MRLTRVRGRWANCHVSSASLWVNKAIRPALCPSTCFPQPAVHGFEPAATICGHAVLRTTLDNDPLPHSVCLTFLVMLGCGIATKRNAAR